MLAAALILTFTELILSVLFLTGLLGGTQNNLFLGTILGLEFLILAVLVGIYIRVELPPRLTAESREEGMLW